MPIFDYRLNARDPFAMDRSVEQRRIFEGNLTGPVGRSKTTSFLISANREEDDFQALVFALAPSGPVRENVPSPARNTELSASVTRRIGETHLISLRGLYTDRTIQNQGAGGFTLPEAGAGFEDREDLFFFNHQGFITPKLLNQFRKGQRPLRHAGPGRLQRPEPCQLRQLYWQPQLALLRKGRGRPAVPESATLGAIQVLNKPAR
jgi:hypothetical protein